MSMDAVNASEASDCASAPLSAAMTAGARRHSRSSRRRQSNPLSIWRDSHDRLRQASRLAGAVARPVSDPGHVHVRHFPVFRIRASTIIVREMSRFQIFPARAAISWC
jgi:hypothetical protein